MFLPVTYRVDARGRATLGGCDLLSLCEQYGTPLYVYDRTTAEGLAREYVTAMAGQGQVLYSAKAFYSPAFLALVREAGCGAEVASAGELRMALAAGFSGREIHVLGNNKSVDDVDQAFRAGATLVIDGEREFELVSRAVPEGSSMRCLVRISPGVKPATHDYIATGQLDSKFGFAVAGGFALGALERARAHPQLHLEGIHFHVGSQIHDLAGHLAALEVALDLAFEARERLGWTAESISAGGGLGIAQVEGELPPTPTEFVTALLAALGSGLASRGLSRMKLKVEPGRSIAGPAAVALYTVGSIKRVPGVRTYVAVDGGMGDNLRPKLYGARYQPLAASKPLMSPTERVTIVGKYCESTDVLAEDASLPALAPEDVVMFPASGAYHLSMASNYNGMPRPAVVLVGDGEAKLIRRRESIEDLLRCEVY